MTGAIAGLLPLNFFRVLVLTLELEVFHHFSVNVALSADVSLPISKGDRDREAPLHKLLRRPRQLLNG